MKHIKILPILLVALTLSGCGKEQTQTPQAILAEQIDLKETKLELIEGELYQLSVAILPREASIQYHSSDESVAYVDNKGEVYALKRGQALISISSGSIQKVCEVSVVQMDDSKTFDQLPIPEFKLLGETNRKLVYTWEDAHGGTFEPRLSRIDKTTGVETVAFNVRDDKAVKLRIYNLSDKGKVGHAVSEIGVYATPIDYVFEIQGSNARLNLAFRKLMVREGYLLSHITSLGAAYVNPKISMGVIISPARHPELGALALFNYKQIYN